MTIEALRTSFPDAEVIVADDGSCDTTAAEAERAGAFVLRLPRRGKGQALSAAERVAPPGRLLLADADLRGELAPLADSDADLAVASFAHGRGGGLGLAKGTGRALIRLLGGLETTEPLSGQRAYSARARAAVFPLAPGFGCEVRATIDAARAGLRVEEVELDLEHRATGRDLAGFAHRGRQLLRAAARRRASRDELSGASRAARRLGARRARARSWPRSASPTTSGPVPSAASARTSARARRPASSSSSAFRSTGSGARAASPERCSSASPRTSSTSSTRDRAAR